MPPGVRRGKSRRSRGKRAWRVWRWAVLVSALVPATAAAYLWGASRDVTVDQAWYSEHVNGLVVLANGFMLVSFVLAVGGVGGVVRLVCVVRGGPR